MLIVPYGWDQPDNGLRMERLGVGLRLARTEYSVPTAVAALKPLRGDPRFAARAAEIGSLVREEDGLTLACDSIESLLARSHSEDGRPAEETALAPHPSQ